MSSFSKKDVELLLNDSPLVGKKGFSVTHEKVKEHPKSTEYRLTGKDKEGKTFSFNYVKIEGKALDADSVLKIGQNNFYICREGKDEKHTIYEEEKPKTAIELAIDKLAAIPNKSETGFFNILPESVIQELFKVHKDSSKNKCTFSEYRLKLFNVAIEYKLDVDKLRWFLFDLEKSIKEFRPSPSYVFSEVVRKGKKNGK